MFTGKTPNVTPAQLLAVLAAAGTEAVADGLISSTTEKVTLGVAGIVIPAAWLIADAIIRHGRSRALAPSSSTPAASPIPPPPPAQPVT